MCIKAHDSMHTPISAGDTIGSQYSGRESATVRWRECAIVFAPLCATSISIPRWTSKVRMSCMHEVEYNSGNQIGFANRANRKQPARLVSTTILTGSLPCFLLALGTYIHTQCISSPQHTPLCHVTSPQSSQTFVHMHDTFIRQIHVHLQLHRYLRAVNCIQSALTNLCQLLYDMHGMM
jgi:hypothetical protein